MLYFLFNIAYHTSMSFNPDIMSLKATVALMHVLKLESSASESQADIDATFSDIYPLNSRKEFATASDNCHSVAYVII